MSSRTPRTFLIVCFRLIGDVLVTTPLPHSIKAAYPDASVDYLVFAGTEAVLAKNPDVRTVITTPKGGAGIGTLLGLFRKYDVAIAAYPSDRTVVAAVVAGRKAVGLTGGWRKEWWKSLLLHHHNVCYDRIHVVANMLMPLRMLGIDPIPRIIMGYDESDLEYARHAVRSQNYVLLHPYSSKEYKYWQAVKWAALAKLISDSGYAPIFTRTPDADGQELLARIESVASQPLEVLASACSLNQLAAIIKGATAFVGVDTAITHLASALDVPTVAIYGSSLTRYWAPWPNGCENQSVFSAGKGFQRHGTVTVVQKGWDCVPCNCNECSISTRNVMECLEQLSEHEVFAALRGTLEDCSHAGSGTTAG